jgi:hypothetical protein
MLRSMHAGFYLSYLPLHLAAKVVGKFLGDFFKLSSQRRLQGSDDRRPYQHQQPLGHPA